MVKAKRIERVAALSKLLADHPYRLFSFSYFCKKFAIAKSTLSEDSHLYTSDAADEL